MKYSIVIPLKNEEGNISALIEELEPVMKSLNEPWELICIDDGSTDHTYELMRDCRSAIAKSGTVTLELALHQCPTVVMYKLTKLNRFIAQYILRLNLPHYCIVNILAQKTVFPELIEKGLSANKVFEQIKCLTLEQDAREKCLKECKEIPVILEKENASTHAAQAIKELIS